MKLKVVGFYNEYHPIINAVVEILHRLSAFKVESSCHDRWAPQWEQYGSPCIIIEPQSGHVGIQSPQIIVVYMYVKSDLNHYPSL